MVDRAASPPADRLFRHARVRGADADGAAQVAAQGRRARVAARPAEGSRPSVCARRRRRNWLSSAAFRSSSRRSCATKSSSTTLPRFGADLGVVAAYGRILPGRPARDSPSRDDQRARLAPACLAGRRPCSPRRDRGRQRHRRHDHACRPGARRRADARARDRADRARRDERGGRSACSPSAARALLLDVVEQFAAGAVVETPQDDAQATHAPKIAKTEGPIDWSLPAARIHNLVRGPQPWPLASTTVNGRAS